MYRALTVTALCAALATPALALDFEEPDPADLVPAHFSAADFARLDQYDLYDVTLALKRGRNIRLADCTPSQSRAIFEASYDQRAPALDMLRTTCAG
ncbi:MULTISPECIES: hypothetical protein [unclassified Roseovarius]|uniref:hypothetical protein n=1 Tax=unclassified Roseovarius TaxID=2614913 RepID=UPI00273E01F8|nr:hypothetical protein [Roseovarius sp. MMSF_3350]